MGRPPVSRGELQVTVASLSPGTAFTSRGTDGGPNGATASVGGDAGLMPAEFSAATVKETGAPFSSPVTTALCSLPETRTGLSLRPEGVTT